MGTRYMQADTVRNKSDSLVTTTILFCKLSSSYI